MLTPLRAAVRPRVLSPATGEVLPLEEEVLPLVEKDVRGAVQLVGPAGSGKTTALRHLAGVLPPGAAVVLLDEPALEDVVTVETVSLVVYTRTTPFIGTHLAVYRLASWGRDDLIEYLLATHPGRCGAVMARLSEADHLLFQGIPDLWQLALEELAGDDSLPDARAALNHHLHKLLADTDLLERARSLCLTALAADEEGRSKLWGQMQELLKAPGLARVLRHEAVRLMLAADRVAADLRSDAACDFLAPRLPRELIEVSALTLGDDARAREHLHRLLAGPSWSHAMAASLLHATGAEWRPAPGSLKELTGAYLPGIRWAGVDLTRASLAEADLSDVNLRKANLSAVVGKKAILRFARLAGANLCFFEGERADLSYADLSETEAFDACFAGACLEGCRMDEALLRRSVFEDADLTAAIFRGADLTGARFGGATVERCDFSDARLHEARLGGLCLRETVLAGAVLSGAQLEGCDLESLHLPEANFERAILAGALLTDSVMPGANFRGADLRNAGLAGIEWEEADLRDADLTGASFHLGSTRGGLVGSTIPCEGSKTGFYTDDYQEQTFRAPEEVRKANLCGADLRGAKVAGTDFYLVDLRGAKYDTLQENHFRRCRAILEDHR